MKKLIFVSILLFLSLSAIAQIENTAKEVLNAYKTRNVEILKKNASGMMKMAIPENYFEDKDIQKDIKAAESWNGEFREIRYNSDNMMGKVVYISSLYFADVEDNAEEIYIVVLSSTDTENWVMFGTGIVTETKEEFSKMRLTLHSLEGTNQQKVATKPGMSFSLEMYDGPRYEKVTQKQVEESFATLSEDNFFVSLTSGDDWMQVAYSDKGYSVDFNDTNGHFMVDYYLKKEEALQLLVDYLNQIDGWNKNYTWVDFTY